MSEPAPDPAIDIRPAGPADAEALSVLCALHAAYERAPFDPVGHAARLAGALSASPPRIAVQVADRSGELVGFVSVTEEFATWTARPFLHMDCLFLREGYRGSGLGRRLVATVIDAARRHGVTAIQWQTPTWNDDAKRFYARLGAVATDKTRYTLAVP